MGTDLLVTVQDNGAGFDVKEYFNSLEQAENGSSREKIGPKKCRFKTSTYLWRRVPD